MNQSSANKGSDLRPRRSRSATGGYEIAFQANTGLLYTSQGTPYASVATGQAMQPGTSPPRRDLGGRPGRDRLPVEGPCAHAAPRHR
ncbi:MAG: hypothetical protein M3Z27_00995 [Actinomycetota bacterium]|nr:hypothetical protein [Actinomycetota bacterium]